MRIGHGYDIHRLQEDTSGKGIILAGVTIPFEKKFIAHSDGDVAFHALIDALLGASALGDIGTHFPDTDQKYKNIDSSDLLKRVVNMLYKAHYAINNVDLTIVAQKPKLAPYIKHMNENLSTLLNVSINDVNVKAKTNENLDSLGASEAIAVYAVATIINKD